MYVCWEEGEKSGAPVGYVEFETPLDVQLEMQNRRLETPSGVWDNLRWCKIPGVKMVFKAMRLNAITDK